MELELREALESECEKHIRRYFAALGTARRDQETFQRKTAQPGGIKPIAEPLRWSLNRQFNPFKVRARRDSYAFSLYSKIRTKDYCPLPALRLSIPKPAGGNRSLSVFSVVDAALSKWLYRRLTHRHGAHFSSYSYAYRADRNAQHAIDYLARYATSVPRLYVVEYDFTKYFDNVTQDYLTKTINSELQVSPLEAHLLTAFINYKYATGIADYLAGTYHASDCGFPQGTAVSLFLANVASMALDREIERTGSVFARFADDTIVLCPSYSLASDVACLIENHGKRCGARVNVRKSDGISVLSQMFGELRQKHSFVFLSYEISQAGVSLSDRAVKRIKRYVAKIVYRHLLLYPKRGYFSPNRISPNGTDWDLVTCLNAIRRYLHGRLDTKYVTLALEGQRPLGMSIGAMAFFPLIDCPEKLKALDGWLLDLVERACKKRGEVVGRLGHLVPSIDSRSLLAADWYKESLYQDIAFPSFVRAWRYFRKCYKHLGLDKFPVPPYSS